MSAVSARGTALFRVCIPKDNIVRYVIALQTVLTGCLPDIAQMLRITVHHGQGFTSFGVEGSLTEPSAEELKKCWQNVCACGPPTECVSVNLTVMTNIDAIGRGILFDMYRGGVRLVGSGVMTRAVINEITCRE